MRSGRSQPAWILACVAAPAILAPASFAQPDQPASVLTPAGDLSWMAPMLAGMDDPDPARRLDAAQSLANDHRLTLASVEQRIAGAAAPGMALSAEQRESLLRIGRRLFDSTPRAAMGVQFARVDGAAGGVEISGTVPGFDSQRLLRPGDLIRSIDGFKTPTQSAARVAIVCHDPGQTVPVEVLRRGEPVVVQLTFGSFAELTNGADLGGSTLDAAWELRLSRVPGALPDAELDAGWALERWVLLEEEARLRLDERQRQESAVGPDGLAPRTIDPTAGPFAVAGGAARDSVSTPDPDFVLVHVPGRNRTADALRAQITVHMQTIRALEQQLKGRIPPGRNRRMIEVQLANAKRQVDTLRQQLRVVRELDQP
jgi:hypothetical protein